MTRAGKAQAVSEYASAAARKQLGHAMLKASGWSVEGEKPAAKRYVLLAAPHTSNWDLPVMLAITFVYELRVHWMGKHTLFAPPFGPVMRALGGLPIERHKHAGVVEATAHRFQTSDELVIAIPPEATRSRAPYWRSGFYRIAQAANVPIALGYLDYGRRVGGIGPLIMPSGNVRADMDKIRAFYAPIQGKFPDKFAVPRLKEEDEVAGDNA